MARRCCASLTGQPSQVPAVADPLERHRPGLFHVGDPLLVDPYVHHISHARLLFKRNAHTGGHEEQVRRARF